MKPEKRFLENADFPSNVKHPKLDANGSFPLNCSAPASARVLSDTICPKSNIVRNSAVDCRGIACGNSPSRIKRPKVDAVRDFPEHCGPFARGTTARGTNGGETELSADVEEKCRRSSGAAATPAVPLRSAPTIDAKPQPEKSVSLHGEGDDDEQKKIDGNENKVGSREEFLNHDFEDLTALIAQAKEYTISLELKFSTSKEVSVLKDSLLDSRGFCIISSSDSDVIHKGTSIREPKLLGQVKEEKPCDEILIEFATIQDLARSISDRRVKVEDSVSKVFRGKQTSRLEIKLEENDDEVCILSPTEWNILKSSFKKCHDAKASVGKPETKPETERCSAHNFTGERSDMVEFDLRCESVPDWELTETKCREENQKHGLINLDECASLGKKKQDEWSAKFLIDDGNGTVRHSDIEEVANSIDEPKCNESHKGLINLSIVQHDQPEGFKVRGALKLFEDRYTELLHEQKGTKYAHFGAAESLKAEGIWISTEKPFGHIPGIEIGDEFRFRAELMVVGLHRHLMCGIDYVFLDGKKFATSVVNSGRYENEAKTLDVLIYSGQGGNPKFADKADDQKLEKGNLALMNSMEMGYPVRVTHKRKGLMTSNTGMSNKGNFVYVYDGLYLIKKFWQEKDQNGKLVFKFKLHRMPGQPRLPQAKVKSRKMMRATEVCMVDDVSQGKENMPIRAMNGVDDDKPRPFTYSTNIVYPIWYQRIEPIGCNCIHGCSNSEGCPCVLKNEGEIPFNEKGEIIRARPIVHECGPSCKCPPSCMNRVSQHGPYYQLEIFKTLKRGWGVRSRNHISSGSFICEYVGELLQDREAEKKIGDDEYLFDINDCRDEGGQLESNDDGFAIDAAICGNIGRFINHSCSPNLYSQEVLYDHDDKRLPHIMFFATKNIPPLQELTYDYNYKIDRVCDVNGNIKTKDCYCGSRKCTRRMY